MKTEYVWTHPSFPGKWRWIDCVNDVVQFASLDGHEDVYTNRRQSGFTLWTPGEVFTEWVDFDSAEPFANPLPKDREQVWLALMSGEVRLGSKLSGLSTQWGLVKSGGPWMHWRALNGRKISGVYAWCPLVVPDPPPRKEI